MLIDHRRSWRGRLPVAILSVVIATLVSGCGQDVIAAPPEPAPTSYPTDWPPPYDGPLEVAVTSPPGATSAERGGAAGRVVRCTSTVLGGYSAPDEHREVVSSSPTDDLERALSYGGGGVVVSTLLQVRADGPRQLWTYDVDGLPKLALVFLQGTARDQRVGWWIETWARCDIAEFPDAIARARGVQVWVDGSGRRLPTTTISSSAGPQHCDWESMTLLFLGAGDDDEFEDQELYVSDVQPGLEDYFDERYVAAGPLPADAVDTGWSYRGRHLWLDPQRRRAYVGSARSVQIWPRTVTPLGCA